MTGVPRLSNELSRKRKATMEEFNINEIVEKIMECTQNEYKKLKTLNVMILGKTGVGKSTLINNMFNEELAETGQGKPVTQSIRKLTKPGLPLSIYDTPGVELAGKNGVDSLLDEVTQEIDKGIRSGNIDEAIHCIWYCISTPSNRFETAEKNILQKFLGATSKYDVPVIFVLTQSFSKSKAKELKSEIAKENLPVVNIVPVLAADYPIDDEYVAKAYGLDRLAEVTYSVVPEALQKTFVAVQKANLELKRKKAQAVVATAMTAAAATGAAPIPFSDAALLVPAQISMLAGITAVFGLPIEKGTIAAILSSTIGTTGTTVLGKTVVANLLKFIPGVGSAAGGVISGGTAATLTAALGEAYISIMLMICKGDLKLSELDTAEGKQKVQQIFTKELKISRN